MKINQQKNIKEEAKNIIAYVRQEHKKPKLILNVFDLIIRGDSSKLNKIEQNIAEFIGATTSYVTVEKNYNDIDVEKGDWGIPVITGGGGYFVNVTIEDKNSFILLGEEISKILNKGTKKISDFILMTNKPRWCCQKCGRFLGIEFLSTDEVQKLLNDFSIGKYRGCRRCKTENYFSINSDGIKFKIK